MRDLGVGDRLHASGYKTERIGAYHGTGLQPVVNSSSSPLITLLQSLHPRERLRIASVTISLPMGYTGSRIFQNAQQALNWPLPAGSPRNVPSQSWQDKRFRRPLTVDDLGHHATVPADVAEAWWRRHPHLRRSQP